MQLPSQTLATSWPRHDNNDYPLIVATINQHNSNTTTQWLILLTLRFTFIYLYFSQPKTCFCTNYTGMGRVQIKYVLTKNAVIWTGGFKALTLTIHMYIYCPTHMKSWCWVRFLPLKVLFCLQPDPLSIIIQRGRNWFVIVSSIQHEAESSGFKAS